jgi:hypothetical protein
MNIYRYEFEYKVYNSNGLEVDKGIETSKGYDEVRAENYLRTKLEEGCQSDEEVELKLIPSFVKYTDANKLIAEFMGDDVLYGQLDYCTDMAFPFDDLHFHESWDWLMPVVEKIESLGYELIIAESRCKINHNTDHSIEEVINIDIIGSKIEATYQVVVEFINEYNLNK